MRDESKELRRARRLGFAAAACILALGVLVLTSLSALSYKGILGIREDTRQNRTVLSYIRSQVCAHDRTGDISTGISGALLILREHSGEQVYELRIYVHEGMLMEEYAAAGQPLDPAKAAGIGKTETFSARWLQEDLLQVCTDQGEILLHLEAAGEGDSV